jgi:hypothetical protein
MHFPLPPPSWEEGGNINYCRGGGGGIYTKRGQRKRVKLGRYRRKRKIGNLKEKNLKKNNSKSKGKNVA